MSNPTLLDATEQELLRAIMRARSVSRIGALQAQLDAYQARKGVPVKRRRKGRAA